jgi:AcrR family transcriptional regulator
MLGSERAEAQEPRRDRRAARRQATMDEIVEAAWTLARSQGLAGFSLRDLAAAVDMQAPSLYQYFASKDAIYDAMFGEGMRQALAVVGAPIETRDRRDALRENGRRIVEFATSDPARAQLLFQRTIPGFEPSPASYAPAVEMSARVQALLAEHGITDPDAMDLWTAVMSGLINQQLANDPGGTRWIRLVDRTVDMFLAEVTGTQPKADESGPKRSPKTKRKGV